MPSLRIAALMKVRVVHVFTHYSIGLGEDGPTHQPVEHLAAMRAMPNFYVWRPADSVETVECWQAALKREHSPSILALTRQGLPALRTTHEPDLAGGERREVVVVDVALALGDVDGVDALPLGQHA